MDRKEQLIRELYDVGAVKFGEFKLKSGIMSPFYIDLRVIISRPSLVRLVSDLMWDMVKEKKGETFELICGVPYTGLPIAACMSLDSGVSMVMKRKEAKDYGTKKMVEGIFSGGESCLIVEDIITSGASVLETVTSLKQVDLSVKEVVVLVDREQGGRARLTGDGFSVNAVLTVSEVVGTLERVGSLTASDVAKVQQFLKENQVWPPPPSPPSPSFPLSYSKRAGLTNSPILQQVFNVMERKHTNVCLSADVSTSAELLQVVEQCGPHICMLKTHMDTLGDFDESVTGKLAKLAKEHDFVIFEDRKFADIGNTVASQFKGGVHKIAEWSQIINAHTISGPGIVESLRQVSLDNGSLRHGLLLIAQMSSKGSLCKGAYTESVVKTAQENPDFVMGYICQEYLGDPKFLHCTPGVKIPPAGDGSMKDGLGQQYTTPEDVISRGCDVIIVGRGILQHPEGATEAAKKYKEAGWKAYEKRLSISA